MRPASALTAARAPLAAGFCLALAVPALVLSHPLVLAAVGVAALAAAAGAGVLAAVRRPLPWAIGLALAVTVVNALVARQGLTVLARLGTVPPFGRIDVTAEGLAAGAILGLRIAVLLLVAALYAAVVDADELLRSVRRGPRRTALTATLALRVVPVLARDGRRLADARRCRPPGAPGAVGDRGARVAVLRAVTASALDRATDLAMTLETRGYARARPAPGAHRPWSRHDRSVAAAAAALVLLAVAALVTGTATFSADPVVRAPLGAGEALLAVAIPAIAAAPLLDRRGAGRWGA